MIIPRLLAIVVFTTVVCFAKAKHCTVANASIQNTTMEIANSYCTTFSSTPCEKTENITELQLSRNQIGELKASMFTCLRKLTDLHINNNKISKLERGTFSTLTALERLDLRDNFITEIDQYSFAGVKTLKQLDLENNSLRNIAPGSFDSLASLSSLKLKNNRLLELPEYFVNTTLTTLDLSNNPVKRLDARILKKYIGLMNLYLMKTDIETLPDHVFRNNRGLRLLSLRDSKLKKIEQKAFAGTQLKSLDLMRIEITELPGEDLKHLQHLIIKGIKDLWTIPIVSFKNLQSASVEYAFHCCLIKTEVSGYRGLVATQSSLTGSWPTIHTCPNQVYQPPSQPASTLTTRKASDLRRSIANNTETILTLPSCIPSHWKIVTRPPPPPPLNCTPKEDAFNPCGDLLGSLALRICAWFVLVFALLGNAFKLFVLVASKRKMTIYKILMCNLALANLCMGVFLCMLAGADLHSLGEYQNFAKEWQYRNGCRAAGFLSIFSTELAAFVLTVITLERYFMIVHPLNQDKHLNTNQVVVLVVFGWLFSATMAALPLFNISSYEKVAICLPFDVEDAVSRGYVTFLLVTNGLAFFFVVFCYGRMYCSLGGSRSSSSTTRVEGRVAKRMAMLVFTNFVCWFPIALVSLVAIYEKPLVSVPAAKFLLVFVYPINSFTNPYLYAIGTKHFQLDALEIFRQLGICNASIEKVTNRLRDQLDTMPISSRGQTGSKLSLSSTRSPSQSPGFAIASVRAFFSREDGGKSNGNALRGGSNSRLSRSSKTNSSCSPCNLTIPLIHKKTSWELSRKCSADSRCSCNSAVNVRRKPSTNNSLDQEMLSARRTSAKDIALAGCSHCKPGSEEAANGELSRPVNHVENSTEERPSRDSNTSFKVPTVMLTTY